MSMSITGLPVGLANQTAEPE